jgi:hypothetical protein
MLTDKELEDIRRKMLELEEEPPAGGWSRIQPDIRPGWWIRFRWWFTGGLLLVGIFSGLMIYESDLFNRLSESSTTEQTAVNEDKLQEAVLPELVSPDRKLPVPGSSDRLNSQATATGPGEGNNVGINQVQESYKAADEVRHQQAAPVTQQQSTKAIGEGTTSSGDATTDRGANVNRQVKVVNGTKVQQKPVSAQNRTASAKTDDQAPIPLNGAGGVRTNADDKAAVNAGFNSILADKTAAPNKDASAGKSKTQSVANGQQADEAVLLQPTPQIAASNTVAKEKPAGAVGQEVASADKLANADKEGEAAKESGVKSVPDAEVAASSLKAEAHPGEEGEVPFRGKSGKSPEDEKLPVQELTSLPVQLQVMPGIADVGMREDKNADDAPLAEALPVITPRGYLLDTVNAYFIADSVLAVADSAAAFEEATVVNKDKNQAGAWSVAVFFAPRYAYKTYKPNGEDEVLITRFNNGGGSAKDRMGYELGISVAKAITPRLQLETSLGFMQLKENVSYTYTKGQVDTLIRQVTADGQLQLKPVLTTAERQLVSNYAYGSWRVGANYYFWQNNLRRFNISVAGGLNLLIKGSTKVYTNGELLEIIEFPAEDNPLEQLNYNVQLGIGYNLRVHPKFELSAAPMVNYFMGSTFTSREPFGLRPYTLGLNLQLRRTFSR